MQDHVPNCDAIPVCPGCNHMHLGAPMHGEPRGEAVGRTCQDDGMLSLTPITLTLTLTLTPTPTLALTLTLTRQDDRLLNPKLNRARTCP